jgi:predicted nucleic-acid-binding protein
MRGLDTNILVRFFAQDDPLNSPRADAIMKSLTEEEPGWLSLVAVAEFVWVMRRRFKMDRTMIHTVLNYLLTRPAIVIEQDDLVRKAASLFLNGNAEYSDYLVALAAQAAGCKQTLTFDRKAARSAGMTLASRGGH